MRDVSRLDAFYDELKQMHKEKLPDWRFGQLFYNFFEWIMVTYRVDPFFIEDDKMIERLREYFNIDDTAAYTSNDDLK